MTAPKLLIAYTFISSHGQGSHSVYALLFRVLSFISFGTLTVTTALVPITLPSPIVTPNKSRAPSPIHTLLSIMTGPLTYNGRYIGGIDKCFIGVLPCALSEI